MEDINRMSYHSETQEREGGYSLNSSLKRKREDDTPHYSRKITSLCQTPSQDIGSNTFRSITLQNGDVKAFWYFPQLRFEIDNNKKSFKFSEWFFTGNCDRWKILLWPCKTPQSLGLYVQMDIPDSKFTYKKLATVYMEAYFTVGSKLERKIIQNFSETFSFSRIDWGYDTFFRHSEYLHYLSNPTVFEITISPQVPHEESKSVTGFNGITNQGTTCYMNSLLQTLFFLSYFRKAVYLMPTSLQDTDRLPLSLQLIFYHLQFRDTPACTRELLTSFGWGQDQWSVQHDVQEFNCVLSDTLERKMKGTQSEGTYTKLFIGRMKTYIECTNVEYKSAKIENFTDLQLNVNGCKDVYESFDKYTEAEYMSGNDKYETEGFGLQDAKRGVAFEELPAVLQLQLKRFEYDSEQAKMVKLNHRYEFSEQIDLNKYVLNSDGEYIYRLFSILVHKGSANTGHYYSYISPKLDGEWYLFNDDSVEKSLSSQALQGNFGGENCELQIDEYGFVREIFSKNEASAYMLVYIKANMKDIILQEVTAYDIPENLHKMIENEQREKEEAYQKRILKESTSSVYLVTQEMVLGWDKAGISPPDSEVYSGERFSACASARYTVQIPKGSKGKNLLDMVRKYAKEYLKLWVYTPGFTNWTFKELDHNDFLLRQVNNKAVFIESDQILFEKVNEEWKLIDTSAESPGSQSTEVLDDLFEHYNKVFAVFKWYDWNNGDPKIEVIRAKTATSISNISAIRNEVYYTKFVTNLSMPHNIFLHHEKSKSEYGSENGLSIDSFGPGENYDISVGLDYKNVSRHVSVNNGDSFIAELQPDVIPDNYINAKQWLASLISEVTIQCMYHDTYEKFGFTSYSRKIISVISTPPVLRIQTKVSHSQKEFMAQIAERFSIQEKINFDQIQLYFWEDSHTSPTPIPFPDEDKPQSMSGIIKSTNMILFDIFPFSAAVIQKKLLVYVVHVDSKFRHISQYCKLLEKSSLVKDLDQSMSKEMMEICGQKEFATVDYYLLSHPQGSIIEELKMHQRLEVFNNNWHYLICFMTISKEEKELADDKRKLFLYVYNKGSTEGQCEIFHAHENVTCKELVGMITSRFEEKVKIMIGSNFATADKREVKISRTLEDSDQRFFEKYPDKPIGVELPSMHSNISELRIN